MTTWVIPSPLNTPFPFFFLVVPFFFFSLNFHSQVNQAIQVICRLSHFTESRDTARFACLLQFPIVLNTFCRHQKILTRHHSNSLIRFRATQRRRLFSEVDPTFVNPPVHSTPSNYPSFYGRRDDSDALVQVTSKKYPNTGVILAQVLGGVGG